MLSCLPCSSNMGKCYQMKLTAPYTPLKWVTFILELPGGPWLISLFHAPDRFFFQNRGTPIPRLTWIRVTLIWIAALNWATMLHKCSYSELRFGFLHLYEIIASNYICVLRLFMEEKKGKAKQPPTQQVFTCWAAKQPLLLVQFACISLPSSTQWG